MLLNVFSLCVVGFSRTYAEPIVMLVLGFFFDGEVVMEAHPERPLATSCRDGRTGTDECAALARGRREGLEIRFDDLRIG